jgi:branched-chain amino acid transport system substrate-binding protein
MALQLRILLGVLTLIGAIGQAQAEDGVTDTTIRIGQTVGVTGTVAGPVKEMNEGAAAYFNLVNKNGGVHSRKIELITLDEKFDPAITKTNAEALIKKEKVFAMFQGRGTPHNQGHPSLADRVQGPALGSCHRRDGIP